MRTVNRAFGSQQTKEEIQLIEFLDNWVKLVKTSDPYAFFRSAYDLLPGNRLINEEGYFSVDNDNRAMADVVETFLKTFYFGSIESPETALSFLIVDKNSRYPFCEAVAFIGAKVNAYNDKLTSPTGARWCSMFRGPERFEVKVAPDVRDVEDQRPASSRCVPCFPCGSS